MGDKNIGGFYFVFFDFGLIFGGVVVVVVGGGVIKWIEDSLNVMYLVRFLIKVISVGWRNLWYSKFLILGW